jgi:hypothetical protein
MAGNLNAILLSGTRLYTLVAYFGFVRFLDTGRLFFSKPDARTKEPRSSVDQVVISG